MTGGHVPATCNTKFNAASPVMLAQKQRLCKAYAKSFCRLLHRTICTYENSDSGEFTDFLNVFYM